MKYYLISLSLLLKIHAALNLISRPPFTDTTQISATYKWRPSKEI